MKKKWNLLAPAVACVLLTCIVSGCAIKRHSADLKTFDIQTAAELKEFLTYTEGRAPLVSAHRGGPREGFPENCIATFANTLAHTPALLEIDPRYTKDSAIVLMHDATLDRTTNGHGKVSDYTLAELRKLRLKDTEGNLTDYRIPTLDEALQWAKGKTILVIDAKDVPIEVRARKIIENKAEANAILISYSIADTKTCYELSEDIVMEVMMSDMEQVETLDRSGVPWQNVVSFVSHNLPDSRAVFDAVHHRKGLCILGSSRNYDRRYIEGEIGDDELKAGYRQLVAAGADIIEADLAIEAGEALQRLQQQGGNASGARPNILWIVADDLGTDLACYGTPLVKTPHLDRLASEGVLYTNLFGVASVCSPSRSSLVTGMYPVSINSHQHRPGHKDSLPSGIRPISEYLREQGYFVSNGSSGHSETFGKTDYNFAHDPRRLYDGSDWSQRAPGQPFFAQIQIKYPHRPFAGDSINPIDPDKVVLPPNYPNTALARKDWALYLETVQLTDRHVGAILQRLEEEGLADNTIVFFFGDQGRPHVRAKQFLYDAGIHTPLIVRSPRHQATAGTKDHRLVSTVDIAATTLALAGLPIFDHIQGVDFLDDDREPRSYVFSMRDRCDETVDRIRSVRSQRFKYIRNFYPDRSYTQANAYKRANYPMLAQMRVMYREGRLNENQLPFMGDKRPAEELYDIQADPHELHNLAALPAARDTLARYRELMDTWLAEADHGVYPEPAEEIAHAQKLMAGIFARDMAKMGLPAAADDRELLSYWERTLLGTANPDTNAQQPPNIVLIIADDLGYGDLGCYGQQMIRTPNIDALAAGGMRFTNYYAGSTVCAPSRDALLTGKHTGHTYIRGNFLTDAGEDPALPNDEVTMAEHLKKAGYRTALFGKWGLGGEGRGPETQGFDRSVCYLDQIHAHNYYPDYLYEDGEKLPLDSVYSHHLFVDKTLEYLNGQDGTQPFFLYLPYTLPHGRHVIPDNAPYTTEDWPDQFKNYAAMITLLDSDVGRIVRTLRERSLDRNTLILFMSDNGANPAFAKFFKSNGPLRGAKRDMYDGGIRVPLVVNWPGKVPANSTTAHVCAAWDLLPTVCEVAGIAPPADSDGLSLWPLLTGDIERQAEHDYLYWENYKYNYNWDKPNNALPRNWLENRAVRYGKWKAVQHSMYQNSGAEVELYDLETDPGETCNVAVDHPEVIRKIKAIFANSSTTAPYYPYKPFGRAHAVPATAVVR